MYRIYIPYKGIPYIERAPDSQVHDFASFPSLLLLFPVFFFGSFRNLLFYNIIHHPYNLLLFLDSINVCFIACCFLHMLLPIYIYIPIGIYTINTLYGPPIGPMCPIWYYIVLYRPCMLLFIWSRYQKLSINYDCSESSLPPPLPLLYPSCKTPYTPMHLKQPDF